MKTLLSTLAIATALATPALAAPILYVDGGDHASAYYQVLDSLGYSYTRFNAYSADNWSTALSSADVILVGERNRISVDTSAATRAALSDFVSNGGTFIGHAPTPSFGAMLDFLNASFSMSLTHGTSSCGSLNRDFLNADAAAGTSFEGGTAWLDDPSCTISVRSASLPEEALNLYTDGTNTSVFAMGYGEGQLAMLGWDFCTSCANTEDRVGWTDVLGRAINFKALAAQDPADVPEAATIGLLGFGLVGVAMARRRKAA